MNVYHVDVDKYTMMEYVRIVYETYFRLAAMRHCLCCKRNEIGLMQIPILFTTILFNDNKEENLEENNPRPDKPVMEI